MWAYAARAVGTVAVVTVIKTLWASVQGDPTVMRRINGWLTVFWVAMIPVSMAMGWLSSVVYVSALSLWALVSGHWSAWQAARVEVNQVKAEEEHAREDLPGDIVDQLIARTDMTEANESHDLEVEEPATTDPRAALAARSLIAGRIGVTDDQAAGFLTFLAQLQHRDEAAVPAISSLFNGFPLTRPDHPPGCEPGGVRGRPSAGEQLATVVGRHGRLFDEAGHQIDGGGQDDGAEQVGQ